MSKTYLTYDDVALIMGVTKRTVKQWTAEGRLRPARISTRVVRFLPEDVERFVRAARDEEPQPA